MLNQEKMTEALAWMTREGGIPEEQTRELGDFIRKADPADLQRLNPLTYGEETGLAGTAGESAAPRLFVTAAKAGLFTLEWDLICPLCGGVENHAALGEINKESRYCTLCQKEAEVDLNSQVEVVFSLTPEILGEAFSPYRDEETYLAHHFSRSLQRSPAAAEYLEDARKDWFVLPSGESRRVRLKNPLPGDQYRIISLDRSLALPIRITGEPRRDTPVIIDAEVASGGFHPEPIETAPCDLTVNLRSELPGKAGFLIFQDNPARAEKVFQDTPLTFKPLFTGKKLLNNQSFRNLFRKEDLPENLHIKAGDVTILFTDLKGSTELYERTGDLKAYSLVQEHFDFLLEEVSHHQGALIKTIGDAVMAAFSTPRDGVEAATHMVQAIEEMNRRTSQEGHEIAVKVGLHRGNAMAVNANDRLDYFGQTVNIAARVQGLAAGGEIWITEEIHSQPECRRLLEDQGYTLTRQIAELKGVSRPTPVYQGTAVPDGPGSRRR